MRAERKSRRVTAPLDDVLDEEEHTVRKLETLAGGSELQRCATA